MELIELFYLEIARETIGFSLKETTNSHSDINRLVIFMLHNLLFTTQCAAATMDGISS